MLLLMWVVSTDTMLEIKTDFLTHSWIQADSPLTVNDATMCHGASVYFWEPLCILGREWVWKRQYLHITEKISGVLWNLWSSPGDPQKFHITVWGLLIERLNYIQIHPFLGGERQEAEKTTPQDVLQTSSHLHGILGLMRCAGREGTWVLFLGVLVSHVGQRGMDILVWRQ